MGKVSKKKQSLIKKSKKISKVKRPKKRVPKKTSEVTTSKAEMRFEKFLLDSGIKVKSQFKLNYKFYDFIVEGTNILLEFDGNFHHGHPIDFPEPNEYQKKNILNDIYKNKLAASNGYKLIRVWESDFKEQPRSVAKRIKQIIKEQTKENAN